MFHLDNPTSSPAGPVLFFLPLSLTPKAKFPTHSERKRLVGVGRKGNYYRAVKCDFLHLGFPCKFSLVQRKTGSESICSPRSLWFQQDRWGLEGPSLSSIQLMRCRLKIKMEKRWLHEWRKNLELRTSSWLGWQRSLIFSFGWVSEECVQCWEPLTNSSRFPSTDSRCGVREIYHMSLENIKLYF